jgi:hypothetical protein
MVRNAVHFIVLKKGSTKPWIFTCKAIGTFTQNPAVNDMNLTGCTGFALEGLPKNERIRMKATEDGSKIWIYYLMKPRKRIEAQIVDFTNKIISGMLSKEIRIHMNEVVETLYDIDSSSKFRHFGVKFEFMGPKTKQNIFSLFAVVQSNGLKVYAAQ